MRRLAAIIVLACLALLASGCSEQTATGPSAADGGGGLTKAVAAGSEQLTATVPTARIKKVSAGQRRTTAC